jgi:hypothetical protein
LQIIGPKKSYLDFFYEMLKRKLDMKEWKCVQVGHHNKIAKVLGDYHRKGWKLHTYQATGQATLVSHYLLFEKEV